MKKRTTRKGSSFQGKIKTEHSIVEGLLPMLEELALLDSIQSIIPGRIMRRGSGRPKPSIRLTIPTPSGWKALGKSKGSTQELFIVTNSPKQLEKDILPYQ